MADDMAAKICSRFTHVAITAGIVAAMFVKPTVLHIHWSDNDVVFPVLYLAASISSLALYFLVSCMDPGFVKKGDADVKEIKLIVAAENEEEDEDVSLLQKPSNNLQFDEEKEPSSPSKSVAFNLEPSQRCGLCGLEKPMRAKHCRECRRCVRKFDHHCPWIGNCVGERNHRWFWIFIAIEFAMLSWSMYISTTGYVTKETTREWLVENVMLLIADVVIGVLMMVTFSLLCVHTYLVVSNHTTWEQMSRHRIPYLKSLRESENPFNLGTCRNVYLFCCSLQPRDWSVVYNRSSNHGDDDHPTHALVP